MLKNMLIRSGVVIAGMVVTQVILEKLEQSYLNGKEILNNESEEGVEQSEDIEQK